MKRSLASQHSLSANFGCTNPNTRAPASGLVFFFFLQQKEAKNGGSSQTQLSSTPLGNSITRLIKLNCLPPLLCWFKSDHISPTGLKFSTAY